MRSTGEPRCSSRAVSRRTTRFAVKIRACGLSRQRAADMPGEVRTAPRAKAVGQARYDMQSFITGHACGRNRRRVLSKGFVIALKKPVVGSRSPVGKIVRHSEEISRCQRTYAANNSLVDNEAKTEDLVVETCRGERSVEVDSALPEESHYDDLGGALANCRERVG